MTKEGLLSVQASMISYRRARGRLSQHYHSGVLEILTCKTWWDFNKLMKKFIAYVEEQIYIDALEELLEKTICLLPKVYSPGNPRCPIVSVISTITVGASSYMGSVPLPSTSQPVVRWCCHAEKTPKGSHIKINYQASYQEHYPWQ